MEQAMAQSSHAIDAKCFFLKMRERTLNRLGSPVILYKGMFSNERWRQLDAECELRALERTLKEYVVVSICRLLDTAYTKVGGVKRENVSLRALQVRLRTEGEICCANCIENWFKKHGRRIRECRAIRNRYIDHLDATDHLESTSYTGTTPQRMFRLVDATYALLNRLAKGLGENYRDYYDVGFPYGGEGLLVMLKESAKYRRLRPKVLFNKITLDGIKAEMEQGL